MVVEDTAVVMEVEDTGVVMGVVMEEEDIVAAEYVDKKILLLDGPIIVWYLLWDKTNFQMEYWTLKHIISTLYICLCQPNNNSINSTILF